ncbi:MAG: DUF3791 domain-containing protein [Muribaculaceae bacterium]|nr:DUF3791 domain-containing protein [Muribaculaceae bacterium]
MNYYNPTVKTILRSGRIGMIACRIAEKLDITPLEALKKFYESDTCKKFHDRSTGLYLYSDLYIRDSFLLEKNIPV